jgi:hypothetical protein
MLPMVGQEYNIVVNSRSTIGGEDVNGMLHLAGFETIHVTQEVLWPLPLDGFANRLLFLLCESSS